jgi:hypothetical protein
VQLNTDSYTELSCAAKGGGTLCAGSAAALLVFGAVMPKGELALLVLGVCENFSSRKVCENTRE